MSPQIVIETDTSTQARETRGRIWIDGCFDFTHHGHAGAMLQARQLGTELYVGVHSDEAILENKGPTVMTIQERTSAVEACRWATKPIVDAPYVTQLDFIDQFNCKYVVHGDDITSDSNGEDCYRFVKAAGRFLVVRRTPGISTTDLVGRMLLCTRNHFIKSLTNVLDGKEGPGSDDEKKQAGQQMRQRMKDYATNHTGLQPGAEVYGWSASTDAKEQDASDEAGVFHQMVPGIGPRAGQRVVYVDGGFDLFSSGHIEFLRQVVNAEEALGKAKGWYAPEAQKDRISQHGEDYPPAFVIAGIHDDEVINHWKGVNYPIMNIFERGLCVLQCKYIHSAIFGAPFTPTSKFLHALPYGLPAAVYHGPTAFMPLTYDPYSECKELGIFREVGAHAFANVNAAEIVERIMKSRAMYEERQRKKGEKAVGEEAVKRREQLEKEAKQLEEERSRMR